MPRNLQRSAWTVLLLNTLYNVADALCSVFVGVYFYINTLDFGIVCQHYLVLYLVTPVVFLIAGWYSQARDRVHVFRLGLVLHAVYYGTLLYLKEDSANYAPHLGVLLGIAWGVFWAGNHVFGFDVVRPEQRDYYFGTLSAVTGAARLLAPLLSGAIIYFAPEAVLGYQVIFFVAVAAYLAAILISVTIPADSTRRPYRLWRALLPGRDQRDWQWIMLAAATLSGTFHIMYFLLGLLMYMETGNEMAVGGFSAFQALAGITTAYLVGRMITPSTRHLSMLAGVIVLLGAGTLTVFHLSIYTLFLFGLLQSIAMPMFSIAHSSIKFDVIDKVADYPHERIEYICAWEVPLAIGRSITMLLLLLLVGWWGETGVRVVLFLLCINRMLTYLILRQVSVFRPA